MKTIRARSRLFAVAVGLCFVVFLSPMAWAQTGTVTVNGAVSAVSCTITINGVSTSAATITLPTVSPSLLPSTGSVTGDTPLAIGVTGCTGGTAATKFDVYFTPSGFNSAGFIANTATAPATSALLRLSLANCSTQVLGNKTYSLQYTGQGTTSPVLTSVTQNYCLQYYRGSAALTAGKFQATFGFTLSYH